MLALHLALRAMRTRPAKTLFSVAGISLGVATAVAIFTLDETTVAAKTAAKTEEFAKVDLEVTPADSGVPPAESFARLRAIEGVESAGAIVQSVVELRVDGRPAGRARLVALDAVARNSPAFDAYRVAEGRDLPATDDGAESAGCLLGESLAAQLGLVPGSRIELAPPSEERAVCIDGELRRVERTGTPARVEPLPIEVSGVLARYHLGKQGEGSVVVVPFPLVSRILPNERANVVFWVAKSRRTTPEALKAALAPAFAYSVDRAALIGEAADERAFRNGVRVSGVLALLLGLFVIFHTLSMSLVERVREIAILNAVGATRAQIGRAFFLEGAIVAVTGGALGLALGLGLAKLALVAGYTTLGRVSRVDLFRVSWTPVVSIAAVGVAVALLGSVFPLIKARAIFPARVLAERDLGRATDLFRGLNAFAFAALALLLPALYFFVVPVIGEGTREAARVLVLGGSIFGIFLGFLLLAPRGLAAVCAAVARPLARWRPLEGFLSGRSMTEGVSRVAISAAVLALVGGASITLKGITASLQSEVVSWGDAVEDKFFVHTAAPLPRARVEALARELGAEGFEMLGAQIGSPFLIRGLRSGDVGSSGAFADRDVARKFEETESIVLSTPLARALKADVGSDVLVATSGGPPRRLRVIAVDDGLGYYPPQREIGVVSQTWMKRHFCQADDASVQFALRVPRGSDPETTAKAIRAAISDVPIVSVRSGRFVRDFEIRDIDRDFRLFDLILALVALLAGIGVLNALLLAAIERRKEIGVMKALGMTRGQLAGAVLFEAVVIGVLGGACGVLLGLAFAAVAIDALAGLAALPLKVVLEAAPIAAAFVGAVAIAVVAAAVPIARANRFSAAEAVRYE